MDKRIKKVCPEMQWCASTKRGAHWPKHHNAISPKSQDFDCEAWRPCPAKYSKSTYLEYIDVGSLFPPPKWH